MPIVPISQIVIENRYRSNYGDLESLRKSLSEIGLLQPVVVTSDFRLIAGGRRIAAAKSLGWKEIEVRPVGNLSDASLLIKAERDENVCRKAFTVSEEHALYEALVELEIRSHHGSLSTGKSKTGDVAVSPKVRQEISEIVSGSRGRYKSLERVGEIKRAAADPDSSPRVREVAIEALSEVDLTGNIGGSHSRLRLALKAEEVRRKSDVSSWTPAEQEIYSQILSGATVVVSLRENHASFVRWARAEGKLVEIDRGTEWGNPFEIPFDGDRDTVIANYEDHYLPFKPSLTSRLKELRGKALACWCAPSSCHGDVLARLAGGD